MIIDINFWFLAVVTCLLGAMSPGPSLVVVSHNTMSLGFRYGVITSISHGVGVGIYALLTVFGITLIIQSSDIILPLIRIFGCIFLLYLARNMYHFSWDTNGEKEYKTRSRSTFSVVKDGFLIAALFIETLSAPAKRNSFMSMIFFTPPPTVSGTKHFSAVFEITSIIGLLC